MWVVTAEAMRELEARWLAETRLPEAVLMERAADAVWRRVGSLAPEGRRVAVLAGPGHNGGDGIAVARMALAAGRDARVVLAADRSRLRPLTAAQLAAFEALGGVVVDVGAASAALDAADVVVDALLGIGSDSAPRGAVAEAIALVTECRVPIVSIDLPSGICSDTGRALGRAVAATHTVTFHGLRWGHVLGAGLENSGVVEVADLGVPRAWTPSGLVATVCDRPRSIAPAKATAYKGTRGHLLVVAGSDAYCGAAVMAAKGAFGGGAGLVTVAGPPSVQAAVLAAVPEAIGTGVEQAMAALERFDGLVVGPGLGHDAAALGSARALIAAFGPRPTVVDADAIGVIGTIAQDGVARSLAITPHVGELARLLGRRTADVKDDLAAAAREAHRRHGCVVVAKAAGAVIAGRAGVRVVLPQTSAIGTAGAGDVLAGLIGALALQMPMDQAAETAVWVHQRAGARAAEGTTRGVAATAVAAELRRCLGELERGH